MKKVSKVLLIIVEVSLIIFGITCFIIGTGCFEQRQNNKIITNINNIKYKGHDYICFHDKYTNSFSVVHSPDCKKCLQIFD